MEYIVLSLGGLLVGAVVAWLVASKRAQSELNTKIGEADRKTAAAEVKAASAEATAAEIRKQYEEIRQKADDDSQQLRTQLSIESEARVKADTEKKEITQRLEEEKRLLAEAREKLTDTFKALASTTLEDTTRLFCPLLRKPSIRYLRKRRAISANERRQSPGW